METILALDCGSQSVRAIIFDLNGQMKAKAQIPLPAYSSPQLGWAELPTETFWQSICQACQQLWRNDPNLKSTIVATTLTCQRGSVVTLDKQNQPLRPTLLWMDQRQAGPLMKLSWYWRLGFKIAGVESLIEHFQREAEINWLYFHEPGTWQAAEKFCLLSTYLTLKLTGRYVDSSAAQVGFIPFDYKKQNWAGPTDWRWQAVAVEKNQLPELVKPGDLLGEVTEQASELSGIPTGLPMIASAADKACEVLGTGCLQPHQGAVSLGTTATFNVHHEHYLEHTRFIPAFPSAIAHQFNMEVQIQRGFWLVSWFKNQFAHVERQQAKAQGLATETVLDEKIKDLPPGSEGLVLQPYWSPGIRNPGLEAKGSIIGFSDRHTRFHIYRALLEGLAYGLREGKEKIESRTGQSVKEIRVSGGGAQSDVATQICADVMGLPTIRMQTFETSALGAAMVAAVGMDLFDSPQSAVSAMCHVKAILEPNMNHHKRYSQLYSDVYQKVYGRLKPLYKRML